MPDTTQSGEVQQPYRGEERRQREPSVVVEQHLAPSNQMPPGYRDMTIWQKAWANFGILGLGAFLFVSIFFFFQGMYKDEIQERRARDAEDREIRRAEVAQQDRRSEQMTAELRIMRAAFEAVASRIEASAVRAEAAKQRLEQLSNELHGLIKKIIEAMNKPTKVIDPMLAVLEWALSPPEVAPMPRKAIGN